MNDFQHEWTIIHSDIEKYEQFSLIIKLTCIVISAMFIIFDIGSLLAVLFVLLMWLQDGIWKTFQNRMEQRIIVIENELSNNNPSTDLDKPLPLPFQLYSSWQDQRPELQILIKEYLTSASKPTTAYPYAVLAIIMLLF